MALIVQKYGGSSVATPDKIKNIARRVIGARSQGDDVIVVVSAMGDTTDELLELASQITDDPQERETDMLISTGEQVSIALLSMAIHALGCPVISLTGAQVGILTNPVHTKARIVKVNSERIRDELKKGRIVIVAGFQGINEHNDITTLGRGGSDTTAVALAAALAADVCEIYTDVNGVYTADPRIVPDARKLAVVSYDEMLEMASLGAVVLQPRSVEYAKNYNVVIHVRSSYDSEPGTIVKEVGAVEKELVVSGVTCDKKVAKLAILEVPDRPGIAYQVFAALAEANVNVDMIIQSIKRGDVNDISFTVAESDLQKASGAMQRLSDRIGAGGVAYDSNVAKVSIVGAGLGGNPVVAAKTFGALAEKGINIEMISTSEIKISCLLQAQKADEAVQALHTAFELAMAEKAS
ncbi:MAG: aspartate kinase [bacterium]|jgi:aspartate kinase